MYVGVQSTTKPEVAFIFFSFIFVEVMGRVGMVEWVSEETDVFQQKKRSISCCKMKPTIVLSFFFYNMSCLFTFKPPQ